MHVPEYRKIVKDGKVIVSESSEKNLVSNFVRQMQERGLSCFCAFNNPDPTSDEESEGLIDWTEDFQQEDLMEVIVAYLSTMPKRSKMQFISMLSTMVLNDVIYSDPVYYDDDELLEDEDGYYDEYDDEDDEEFGDDAF
jgi:hypothetical protein